MNAATVEVRSQDPQQLFVSLYGELRRLAQRKLRQGGAAHAMGATTLLHEVYLTVHARGGVVFPDDARFLAYASRAMRGLIIDHARSRQALKRGAGFEITYKYGSSRYRIAVENPHRVSRGVIHAALDGRKISGTSCDIALVDDGSYHYGLVTLG